jgi:phosphoribosylamine--glycine ligase
MREIVEPTARAMADEGTPFSGVLYAGLMLTADGPKLIEYNVRFGDPECEAIMPRIEGDFAALLYAVATGAPFDAPALSDDTTMTVILAALGYPGTPKKGGRIAGLGRAEAIDGVIDFEDGFCRRDIGWRELERMA